jgi:hypothetical protein
MNLYGGTVFQALINLCYRAPIISGITKLLLTSVKLYRLFSFLSGIVRTRVGGYHHF